MMEIVITLVFSVVMLVFMIFPAMKIVEFISSKKELSQTTEDRLTIVVTVLLSLMIGLFLKFF